ncbi:hypothetical protein [Kiloniella antarctica]|uniref:Uncharacterized protein n=1 Tax=Kiloniella antarctica TaxID=1550907 RepID=A0ABW5BIY4_9PROT
MKYVIEKNGSVVSPISVWIPGLAKRCGLSGSVLAPKNLPYSLSNGGNLRAVRLERVPQTKFQTVAENPGSVIGDEWVITQTVTDKPAEQARQIQIMDIKAEATRRIEEITPLWKQVAGGERAIELIEIKLERPWSLEEKIEADYLKAKRDKISKIRVKSNELEMLSNAELLALNVSEDANWI